MKGRRTTSSRLIRELFLAIGCILMPVIAAPQALTGALIGTVKDEQGGVLSGAIVRVSSPALIGGPATATTNERGQLRFPALPPGSYVLHVEAPGFAPHYEEDIRIGVGATIEIAAILKLSGVAQSVVVEGSVTRVEARRSGFETRFTAADFRAIPTRRFSMFDFIRAAPGVSPTSPTSGTDNSASTFGSGTNENLFLIDGTNFTCPCSGGAVAEPGVDIIEEVQIQSVGASAEFGNIQGAVVNVVTRQGSNRFSFDASYYGQPSRLTSQPVQRPVANGSQPFSGYERIKYRDFTTNVGGPVRRNRLWFFGGYQYLRDYDSQPGTDPKFPRKYEQDKVFAKLTWQLRPGLQLVQSFHEEFWVNPDRPTLVKPFEATFRRHATVPAVTFGHLTHRLSGNTLWDLRVGRFVYWRKDDPSTGDWTRPNRFDRMTGVWSGAPQEILPLTLSRTTGKAMLNHYQPGLLNADHEWKLGLQLEKGGHHRAPLIPSGVRFVDNNGEPFQAISRVPAVDGGQFITAATFVSDSVTVRDRITINAGIRFDHTRAISQDLHARDLEGREMERIIRGLGPLYTWNVWSPRLGVTTKLTADGRTMLRASYGRFHQGVLTAELSPIHPGASPITTTAFNPATRGYTNVLSVVDPRTNVQVDPATRAPRTDEYSIGVDRDLGRRLAVAAAYVRKNGGNFISYTDVGGQYREVTGTLADGRSVSVFALVSSTDDRRFLLTNPDGYSLTYNGLVMAVEKRQSHGWRAFGSYTLSRVYGLQPSSGTTAAGAQISHGMPTFGRDPNDLINARGRLPNDRPHIFHVMGSANIPKIGFAVAGTLQHFSGKPWAATAQISLPQGDQRILLEPRGSRRLSSQSVLDVRVSRTISLAGLGRVEVLVDVLNALNDTAEEALATDSLFSANFGQPTVFLDPRRAMIAVRLNLGQ